MKVNTRSLIFFLGLLTISSVAFAQEKQESTEDVDLYSLSLEELMNVPINSASKKDETLFDAPLSSYTITRADIDKAGSTSIMEALRLAPGVIVREQTNGVYDIHIRGFDNILRNGEDFSKSNLTTLVMIDNRPVFNHNLGGTFWETLPVDLSDVDRIEIVRGPSAPLFGPNAVTGVINIITKHAGEHKVFSNANVQYGTPQTTIANASVGTKVSHSTTIGASANYQKRDRFESTYYNPSTDSYGSADSVFKGDNPSGRYPHPKLALDKWGANAFVNIAPNENVSVDVTTGLQRSEVQKNFLGASNGSPFTTGKTNSGYVNATAKVYGLHVRSSFTKGTDNLNLQNEPNRYDYTIVDGTAEYEIHATKNFSIIPGTSYQHVSYSDNDYKKDGATFLNGTTATINTASGFLRTDFKPMKNLRVLAAVRGDKFSSPDKVYLAYEFATTYKLNEKNLIRAALTRSNSGSFIGVNDLNLTVSTPIPGVTVTRLGNKNIDLLTVNMVEFGYRSQLSKSLQLDVDVFRQHAENFNAIIATNVLNPFPGVYIPTQQQFKNVPTSAMQVGSTVSLNFVPNEKLQLKPFVTIQKTQTTDYIIPNADYSITYGSGKHKNTPTFYGGYYINFRASYKWNVNLNGYYYGSQRQYNGTDIQNMSKAGNISGNFLTNTKVAYNVTKQFNVYVNCRNTFNSNSRQYFGTDKIGGLYLIGASMNIN